MAAVGGMSDGAVAATWRPLTRPSSRPPALCPSILLLVHLSPHLLVSLAWRSALPGLVHRLLLPSVLFFPLYLPCSVCTRLGRLIVLLTYMPR